MVQIGSTRMGAQRGPKDLDADAILAENTGVTHVALVQIGPGQKGLCDAFGGALGEVPWAI